MPSSRLKTNLVTGTTQSMNWIIQARWVWNRLVGHLLLNLLSFSKHNSRFLLVWKLYSRRLSIRRVISMLKIRIRIGLINQKLCGGLRLASIFKMDSRQGGMIILLLLRLVRRWDWREVTTGIISRFLRIKRCMSIETGSGKIWRWGTLARIIEMLVKIVEAVQLRVLREGMGYRLSLKMSGRRLIAISWLDLGRNCRNWEKR